ncbi:hypothetical protein V1517DRAFT_341654 [Lipomyces orientalis]|uniref:Uncharacterized protein n=1 Tax=Lipomyces orientalis TaxID=1233043 RepID=A0ACC3TEB8_9ASCO
MSTQYLHSRRWVVRSYGSTYPPCPGAIGADQHQTYYGNPLGMRQGAITSAMAGGPLVGALSSSFLCDRQAASQIGGALWCIGAAVQSASNGNVIYGEPLLKSFLGGQRGSNKLEMLAKGIEMGVLRINRSETYGDAASYQ